MVMLVIWDAIVPIMSSLYVRHLISIQNLVYHIDGLVQARGNSRTLEMELSLSHTNPSICNILL